MSLYDIVGVPFGYLMSFIYSIFGNYAVAIIVFTIVTKILLFPVSYKTQKNAARMQLLNPKLEKLRKSYANNQQKLQEEQQKLYQHEGVNPMGSCGPALIQMLLLFGVIDVVYKPVTHILHISKSVRTAAVEVASKVSEAAGGKAITMNNLRCELLTMEQMKGHESEFSALGENFASKVAELSERFTVFGANLGQTPTLHPETWTREAVILALIPFAAGISQLLVSVYSQIHQKKTNPNMQGGGCMMGMMIFMPVWSIWLAFTLPAGIGFYWIWSSLFSFIITFALNQYFTPERTEEINAKEREKARIYAEKHPGKKTFMQKLMEQQQAAIEEEQKRARVNANGEKMSRSEANKADRAKLAEARKRMAEKYGDDYNADNNDD